MGKLFGECDYCGIVGEVFEVMLPDEAGTIEHCCEDCWENDDPKQEQSAAISESNGEKATDGAKEKVYEYWVRSMDRVMEQWAVYQKNAPLVQDRQFEEMLERQFYYCRKKVLENAPPEVLQIGRK